MREGCHRMMQGKYEVKLVFLVTKNIMLKATVDVLNRNQWQLKVLNDACKCLCHWYLITTVDTRKEKKRKRKETPPAGVPPRDATHPRDYNCELHLRVPPPRLHPRDATRRVAPAGCHSCSSPPRSVICGVSSERG